MLEVRNLSFSYREGRIFQGLDLIVKERELVGIVGPNGAGKSTLLKLISGVLKPSGGTITVEGMDVHAIGGRERARLVSVVPQGPTMPPTYSAMELVLLGRNAHLKLLQWESRKDLEIARSAMELTNCWQLARRPVSQLSGGERQRVLVAMAIAQESPLMLLDEPTSSLDLAHQTGVLDLVSDVQRKRGGAVVIAMHDLTLAAQYCDRIVMISDGTAYADGEPREVLTRENISRVYDADVALLSHPQSGTPVVLPLSRTN